MAIVDESGAVCQNQIKTSREQKYLILTGFSFPMKPGKSNGVKEKVSVMAVRC